MRFEYCFAFAAVLIILFSLGSVAAEGNMTSDDVCFADDSGGFGSIDLNEHESHEILKDSSGDDVDLSVWIDVTNVYEGNDFNQAGAVVPWNITVTASNGTARNTKVYETLSDNMEYVSHNQTRGIFDPTTGIWDIGDLTSSDKAVLFIFTKLKENGRFKNTANATTTSNDVDLSNNWITLPIKSGSGKTTSNVTETSDDKNEVQHTIHQFSDDDNGGSIRHVENSSQSISIADSPNMQANPEENRNSNDDSSENRARSEENKDSGADSSDNPAKSDDSATKSISKSSAGIVSKTFDFLRSSIENIFSPDSDLKDSNSKNNLSTETVKAIQAQNYTKIPIIIFSVFLIILLAIFGYEKVKS